MNRIARVSFLLIGLAIFLSIGRIASGSFSFAVSDFWFIAGILLILLLSLVDQPHFSKDANVFVNATTASVSLFVVIPIDRNGLWWMFAAWAVYLLISSGILMLLRNRPLASEGLGIQFFSRLNRAIGRPEAIFSAFFLWGVFIQFSYPLGSLLISQRTANVTKTILNQCDTIFALRSFDQTGLDFLRNYMGEAYSQAISTLPQFTAILVGKASSSARPIIFKISDMADRWVTHETDTDQKGESTHPVEEGNLEPGLEE